MIGPTLGGYQILGKLGKGGMGEVYRARDPRLDRTVAIKVLPTHVSAGAEARQRFEREAVSIAKLSHPSILAIFEFGLHGGTVFVVTEARRAGVPAPASPWCGRPFDMIRLRFALSRCRACSTIRVLPPRRRLDRRTFQTCRSSARRPPEPCDTIF